MHLKNCTNEGDTVVGRNFDEFMYIFGDYFNLQTSCIDDNYALL